jgi:CubicO group peptidase (beta-lactamase class C family)
MNPDRFKRIPARMRAFIEQGTVAGSVTLVASLEAVGYQDLEDRKSMRADSIFQIVPMTKPVVAVMILVEEGRLALVSWFNRKWSEAGFC